MRRLVWAELVVKLGDITNSGWFLSLARRREWSRRREWCMWGDGVDDAVAGGARHVMPVTLTKIHNFNW